MDGVELRDPTLFHELEELDELGEEQAEPQTEPQAEPQTDEQRAAAEQALADDQHLTPEQNAYLNRISPSLLTKPCPYCEREFLTASVRSVHIKRYHPEAWAEESARLTPGSRIQWADVASARRRVGRPMTTEEAKRLTPRPKPKNKPKNKPVRPKPVEGARAKPEHQSPPRKAPESPAASLARQTLALRQIADALQPLTGDEADRVLVFIQDTHGLFGFRDKGGRALVP